MSDLGRALGWATVIVWLLFFSVLAGWGMFQAVRHALTLVDWMTRDTTNALWVAFWAEFGLICGLLLFVWTIRKDQ